MATIGTHPAIAVIILFIVFFAIFFLLIYGILQYAESRRKKISESSLETSSTEIPTFAKFKTCSYCGTTMPGIASFCPECGSPQIPAQKNQ
jgi:rubrerythrin